MIIFIIELYGSLNNYIITLIILRIKILRYDYQKINSL